MNNAARAGAALPMTGTGYDGQLFSTLSAGLPATRNSPQLRAHQQDGANSNLAALVLAERYGLTIAHATVVARLAGLGPIGAD